MKKSLIVALLFSFFGLMSHESFAQKSPKKYKTYKPKTESVRGYIKKDGKYIAPYMRSRKSKY